MFTTFSTRTARKSLERESRNSSIVFNLHKKCVAPSKHTQHTSETITWPDNLGMSNDKGCHPAVQDFVLKGTDICQELQRKLDTNVTLGILSSHR